MVGQPFVRRHRLVSRLVATALRRPAPEALRLLYRRLGAYAAEILEAEAPAEDGP